MHGSTKRVLKLVKFLRFFRENKYTGLWKGFLWEDFLTGLASTGLQIMVQLPHMQPNLSTWGNAHRPNWPPDSCMSNENQTLASKIKRKRALNIHTPKFAVDIV